jgi:hypothetical protein
MPKSPKSMNGKMANSYYFALKKIIMKKSIIKYGLIGGAISIVFMMVFAICFDKSNLDHGMVVGYIGIILLSLPIYFGIADYAKTAVEKPGYLKQLGTGLLIAIIAGLCYALTWTILYYTMFPDFMEKYSASVIEKATKAHKSIEEIQKLNEQLAGFKKIYANGPLAILFITFLTEPLPVGIIISLISSAIIYYRNKKLIRQAS